MDTDNQSPELPLEPNAAAKRFRCPSCAADMRFDATSSSLACDFCGESMAVGAEGGRTIVEHDLESGLATAQRGFGVAVRTSKCSECGATVSFGDRVTATECDFCGSSQVMLQEENRNLIRPESVVPFNVNNDKARDLFKGWMKGLWFRPSDLKQRAEVEGMNGVYVPYWTFDSNVDSDWTAQAGYHYYEDESYTTTDASGDTVTKTRQVRRTRWEQAWGGRQDHYDDILVCASKGLPEKLADRLRTFDTSNLKPYDPAFLVGWKAEEYALGLNEAWKKALLEMETTQRSRCSGDVPGDTQRFLNVVNRFSDETFKHVLLPIWISSYRYREKVHRFLVNGQTGEITGTAPYSIFKIVMFIAVIVAIITGVVVLVQSQSS